MKRARQRRLMGEINVVPYIDVMLVLLVIFMITAPLMTQGISVKLPKVSAKPLDPTLLRHNEPLVLSIDSAGRFYLNIGDKVNEPVDDKAVLTRIAAVIRRDAKTPVLIKADEAVPYGRVAAGMVLLSQAGAANIGFITKSPDKLDKAGK